MPEGECIDCGAWVECPPDLPYCRCKDCRKTRALEKIALYLQEIDYMMRGDKKE